MTLSAKTEVAEALEHLARLQAQRAKCPRAAVFLELIEPLIYEASEPSINLQLLLIQLDGRVRIGVDLTPEEVSEVDKALTLWGDPSNKEN